MFVEMLNGAVEVLECGESFDFWFLNQREHVTHRVCDKWVEFASVDIDICRKLSRLVRDELTQLMEREHLMKHGQWSIAHCAMQLEHVFCIEQEDKCRVAIGAHQK